MPDPVAGAPLEEQVTTLRREVSAGLDQVNSSLRILEDQLGERIEAVGQLTRETDRNSIYREKDLSARLNTLSQRCDSQPASSPPPAGGTTGGSPALDTRVGVVETKVKWIQVLWPIALGMTCLLVVALFLLSLKPGSEKPAPKSTAHQNTPVVQEGAAETKTVVRVGSVEKSGELGWISMISDGEQMQVKIPNGYEMQVRPIP